MGDCPLLHLVQIGGDLRFVFRQQNVPNCPNVTLLLGTSRKLQWPHPIDIGSQMARGGREGALHRCNPAIDEVAPVASVSGFTF